MGEYSTYSNHGSAETTLETEGTTEKLSVVDATSEQLLGSILKELKKMNLQLAIMTDVHIQNSEVE